MGFWESVMAQYAELNAAKASIPFHISMLHDFYQSFIEGDRWLQYLKGLGVSIEVTIGALILGIILGVLVAVVRTLHDQQRPGQSNHLLSLLNALCKFYTTVIRGTPMMVQLLIMGFVIFSASRNLVGVAVLTMGINSGAYVSEIIRGGIMSIDPGQMEAGRSLGMGYVPVMRHVVIPQAIKNILPALGNEFIMITKDTSLASTFFIGDLMTQCLLIKGATYLTIEPLLIIGIIYFIVTFVLSKVVSAYERRLRRGDVR